MKIAFRKPGMGDDWLEEVDWPDTLRIPVSGEMVDLPDHGQVWIESVYWFLDPESMESNGGLPSIMLIVRA